jgi:hypothetical protein
LISFLSLNSSCRQTDNFPESYIIIFSNDYFETLEYVEIGDQKTENIAMGEDRRFENIGRGNYRITLVTHSQLKIEAPVTLAGSNPSIRITIKNTGKISLEELL